jgi:hypothetical protein
MRHSAESIFAFEFNRISPRIRIYIQNLLAHESGDPGVQFNEKPEGRKSRETLPLKTYAKFATYDHSVREEFVYANKQSLL